METLIDISLIFTYLMVGFAALTAIGFGIKKIMQNTNNTKKMLYSICGLISICLVAYVLSSVFDYSPNYWSMDLVDKKVGVSLYILYFLIFGCVGTILYAELSKSVSK